MAEVMNNGSSYSHNNKNVSKTTINPFHSIVDYYHRNNSNNDSYPIYDDNLDQTFSIENFEIASKQLQLFLTFLYSITAGLALFGNILSILVLMKGKRSSRDLRLFLVNLSLSDILMAICSIPFTYLHFVMGRWIFDPNLCPLVQSMQIVSVFVSIYTLTTIGIDRYIAIMKPFIVNYWTKSFAPVVVVLTWLTGFGLGLMVWFYSNAEPFIINNVTYYDCRESWTTKEHEQIYTVALFLGVFALPLLCLMFFYGSICLKLWYHCAPGNANIIRDNVQYQAKKKVIKMLITIVALFAICWFPSHLFQLIRVFDEDLLLSWSGHDASSPKYLAIVIISHWLSMAHSFVNPIIYSFMSDNFKADVKYMGKQFMIQQRNQCRHRRRREVGRRGAANQRLNQADTYEYPDADEEDDVDGFHRKNNHFEMSRLDRNNQHALNNPTPATTTIAITLNQVKTN